MRNPFRASVSLLVALTLAAGVASAGEGKTPLGKWMKKHMGTQLAGQDFAGLKESLDLVGQKPPPSGSYPKWVSMCQTGSAAAAKQDVAGVKAACKACHDTYKEQYIKEFPTREFP
ncbi:MAG TPA: hypothetical protein VKU41_03415 [Polyangiaceae bacterium]|nr:hypothetical protein [Polyangiaceae bacterium]